MFNSFKILINSFNNTITNIIIFTSNYDTRNLTEYSKFNRVTVDKSPK